MTQKQWKPGRGVDRKGHSKTERFVRLPLYMLNSAAWTSLSAVGVAIYIGMAKRYNGQNNGEISCSVREAAVIGHCGKNRSHEALRELEDKGFIAAATRGSFHWKGGNATEWRLTIEPVIKPVGDNPATKDFMRWQPPAPAKNKPQSPSGGRSVPH